MSSGLSALLPRVPPSDERDGAAEDVAARLRFGALVERDVWRARQQRTLQNGSPRARAVLVRSGAH